MTRRGARAAFAAAKVNRDLGKLDPVTGNALAAWDPTPDSTAVSMLLSPQGSTLYFGGGFQMVASQERFRFAAVNTWDATLLSPKLPDDADDVDAMLYVPGYGLLLGARSLLPVWQPRKLA